MRQCSECVSSWCPTPSNANIPPDGNLISSVPHAASSRWQPASSIRRWWRPIICRSRPSGISQRRRTAPSAPLLHLWRHGPVPTAVLDVGWSASCISPVSPSWKVAFTTARTPATANDASQDCEKKETANGGCKSDNQCFIVVDPRFDFPANSRTLTYSVVAMASS